MYAEACSAGSMGRAGASLAAIGAALLVAPQLGMLKRYPPGGAWAGLAEARGSDEFADAEMPTPKDENRWNATSWRWAHCKVCKAKLWSWDTETGSVQVKLEDRLDVMDPETRRQLPSAVWQRACRVAGKDPKETQQDGKLTAPRKEKAQVNWVKHFDLIRRCVDQEITEKYLEDVLVASGEDPEMVKLSVIEVRKVRAAERAGQARGSEDVTMTQEPTETSPPGMARTSSWSEVSMAEHPDLTFV